ncbi:MAG: ATP-grasp domain-containing protein [Myxococcota bacterium]
MRHDLTIAVTALNATDNPGPGVSVIRALRHHPDFDGRIVGLAYDSLEPGLYAEGLVDDAYLIPYPSQGREALETRLRYIHEQIGLDVIIPTLDSEMSSFIDLEPVLDELGIGSYMPTREQIDMRSKAHLTKLGASADIPTPVTRSVNEARELYDIHEKIDFPFWVKGVFYGAKRAESVDEAIRAFHETVARWGLPVLVQESVEGDEFDVVAVGDGEGGLIGAVPMKKTFLTDKGKGWAGVAIKDPELLRLVERFTAATKWRGPFEFEAVKVADGDYRLVEINPRFPAWVYLSAGAGQNLPYAVAQLAAGESVESMTEYEPGTMFVRISIDQLATMEDFQKITTSGEIHRGDNSTDRGE